MNADRRRPRCTPIDRRCTQRAAVVGHDMADLACRTMRSGERTPIENQTSPDAGAHPYSEDVVDTDRGTGKPLTEQADVGVVGQRDRHAEVVLDHADDVERFVPAGKVRHLEDTTLVDHSGDAHPDCRRRIAKTLDHLHDRARDLVRTRPRSVALGTLAYPMPVIDEPDLDVGTADVDTRYQHDDPPFAGRTPR